MRPTESDTEKNQINPTHKHAPTRQAKRTTMVPSGAQAAAAAAMADALPAISHVQSSPSGSGSVSISLPSRGWSILRTTRSASKAELAGESPATPLFYSILVHNLSHSDLMLGLRSPPDATPAAATAAVRASQGTPTSATSTANIQPPLPTSIIARPKFSRFKQISGRLLTYVENQQMQMTGIEFPSPLATRLQGNGRPQTCPYGFRVKDGQMKFQDWEAFKLKGDDIVANAERMPKPEVIAAYFPMLAVLIPRWLNIVAGKNARRGIRQADQNKKVLFLISGAGTPWNTDHDSSGNSTKGVAKLATWFLNHFYPEIEVHTIHSGVEIFHYDANVSFVNKELKPRIEDVRRILAEKYFDKWPKYMHLATTLTDGASARISAINASLRHLKPDCLHMWQLKSFWHEYPFVTGSKGESDVEFHEFEKLEMTPPTAVADTDGWTKMLVKEMIAHKEEFERVRDNPDKFPSELDTFWLRKSKQPVLSVLMVKKKNKGFKFFRGVNVEVSMPTGSLCLSVDSRVSLACGLTMRLGEFAALLPAHGTSTAGDAATASPAPRILALSHSSDAADESAADSFGEADEETSNDDDVIPTAQLSTAAVSLHLTDPENPLLQGAFDALTAGASPDLINAVLFPSSSLDASPPPGSAAIPMSDVSDEYTDDGEDAITEYTGPAAASSLVATSHAMSVDREDSNSRCRGVSPADALAATLPRDADCVELVLEDGRTLKCTPDHQIMTTLGWVPAGKLTTLAENGTDAVQLLCSVEGPLDQPHIDAASDFTFPMPESCGRVFSLARDRAQVLAIARLLGSLAADGSLISASTSRTGRIEESKVCAGHHIDVATLQADLRTIGVQPSAPFHYQPVDGEAAKVERGDTSQLYLPAPVTRDLAALLNERLDHASLPSFVFSSTTPLSVIREFLAAFFGGDGSMPVPKDDYWQGIHLHITSGKSEQARECAIDVLRSLGEVMQSRFGIRSHSKSVHSYEHGTGFMHQLAFPTTSILAFHDRIGIRHGWHKQVQLMAAATYFRLNQRMLEQRRLVQQMAELLHVQHRCSWPVSRSFAAAAVQYVDGGLVHPAALPTPEELQCAFVKDRRVDARLDSRDWLKQIGADTFFTPKVLQSRDDLPCIKLRVAFVRATPLVERMFDPATGFSQRTVPATRVVDITVADRANFIANGCVVHNCSERNAIGSALSSDPSLCRKDLRMIAVLALPIEPNAGAGPATAAATPILPTPIAGPTSPMTYVDDGQRTHTPHGQSMDTAMDESIDGVKTPVPRTSERSMLSRKSSTSNGLSVSNGIPPTSPALRGRHTSHGSSSTLTVPNSPKMAAAAANTSAAGEESNTPRKRKAPASPTFAPTPPIQSILSPRLTRSGSTPTQTPPALTMAPAAAAAAASSSTSPRAIGKDLSHSTASTVLPQAALPSLHSVTMAALGAFKAKEELNASTPASPRMQTRNSTPIRDDTNPRDKKRARSQNNSVEPPMVTFDAGVSDGDLTCPTAPVERCLSEDPTHPFAYAHAGPPGLPAATDDRNPLAPCGSCNEWLKKVAEVNPDFKVVTFTATDCSTCFIKAVKF